MRDISSVAITVVTFVLFALFTVSCNQREGSTETQGLTVSAISQGSIVSVSVQELHSKDNPYSSEYREWDLWAYSHLTDWGIAREMVSEDPNFHGVSVWIDEEGNVLPQLEEERIIRELAKVGLKEKDAKGYTHASAVGVMENALWQEMESSIDLIVAEYYPTVPDWLGMSPPKQSVLLPEGYIAVNSGPIQEEQERASKVVSHHVDPTDGETEFSTTGNAPDVWHVYDSSGVEVISGKMPWTALMLQKATNGSFPAGSMKNTSDGYMLITDDSGQIISIYDWNGVLVPGTERPGLRDNHYFRTISAKYLTRLYKAQNTLKGAN